LARRAEIEQEWRAVFADVDVRRLDVQVQQLVGMHFAQAVEEMRESAPHPGLGEPRLLHVLEQRAAALVAHHQVDRVVGTEEVQHAHHVGMRKARERPPLLEKAAHAVQELRPIVLGDAVLLDGHRGVVLVVRQVDEREAAGRQQARDAVVLELRAFGERVGGRRHLPYDSDHFLLARAPRRGRCLLCHRPFKA
jgi:hypothetical protein